jgi:hypothetical protein
MDLVLCDVVGNHGVLKGELFVSLILHLQVPLFSIILQGFRALLVKQPAIES